MNTIEGNKMIHDWMGNKRMRPPFENEWIGQQKVEDLKYHTSWDWLMPVVEKIEGMDYCITIEKGGGQTQYCKIIQSKRLFADAFSHNTKIEAVYSAVLQFIQWYTTHSPLNPQT